MPSSLSLTTTLGRSIPLVLRTLLYYSLPAVVSVELRYRPLWFLGGFHSSLVSGPLGHTESWLILLRGILGW